MPNIFSLYLKKIKLKSLSSIYYTIFEGLSKGGSYLLLLIIASAISDDLYIKILILMSFEAIITMLYFSYNSSVLYALKDNKIELYFNYSLKSSITQIIIFYIIYLSFKDFIDSYFEYNLSFLIIVLLGNGFLVNIIRQYSVLFQLELKHSKAIFYKSIPFFVSFLFTLILFFLLDDKIMAFFLGKFVGLLLFLLYIFYNEKGFLIKHKFSWTTFNFFFNRVKYSSLVAILGWASGLGFLNFVKFYSKNERDLLVLGLILNLFVILQMVANGINQVYAPKLKVIYLESKQKGISYLKKTHLVYFFLSVSLVVLVSITLIWKDLLIYYFKNIEVIFDNGNLYVVIMIFFISSFWWVASPFFMILDLFKTFFKLNVSLNIIAWLLIVLLYNLGFNNFILYFLIIKLSVSIGTYFYLKLKILQA